MPQTKKKNESEKPHTFKGIQETVDNLRALLIKNRELTGQPPDPELMTPQKASKGKAKPTKRKRDSDSLDTDVEDESTVSSQVDSLSSLADSASEGSAGDTEQFDSESDEDEDQEDQDDADSETLGTEDEEKEDSEASEGGDMDQEMESDAEQGDQEEGGEEEVDDFQDTPSKLTVKGTVRKRAPKFSRDEHTALYMTCLKHEETIKRKGVSAERKTAAWQEVVDAVNSVESKGRPYVDIRRQINDMFSRTNKKNNRYKKKLKANRKAKVTGLTPQEILCLKWRDIKTIIGPKGKIIHHQPKNFPPVPPKSKAVPRSIPKPGRTPKKVKLETVESLPDISPVSKYEADMQAALQNSVLETAYIDLTESTPTLVSSSAKKVLFSTPPNTQAISAPVRAPHNEGLNIRVAQVESLLLGLENERRERLVEEKQMRQLIQEEKQRLLQTQERIVADRKDLLKAVKNTTENQLNIVRVMASLTYLTAGAVRTITRTTQTPPATPEPNKLDMETQTPMPPPYSEISSSSQTEGKTIPVSAVRFDMGQEGVLPLGSMLVVEQEEQAEVPEKEEGIATIQPVSDQQARDLLGSIANAPTANVPLQAMDDNESKENVTVQRKKRPRRKTTKK